MDKEMQDLCKAIVMYVGFGEAPSPLENSHKVLGAFGRELLEKTLYIMREANSIEVDWSKNSTLDSAGVFVRCEMQKRYPDLSDEALGAIVWKYTFDWR